jgi:hypothetical protein
MGLTRPGGGVVQGLTAILDRALAGSRLSADEASALVTADDPAALMPAAAALRDAGPGGSGT